MQSVASLSGVCILQECYADHLLSRAPPHPVKRTERQRQRQRQPTYTALLINRLRLLFTCLEQERYLFEL
jgi:hypothetical protein